MTDDEIVKIAREAAAVFIEELQTTWGADFAAAARLGEKDDSTIVHVAISVARAIAVHLVQADGQRSIKPLEWKEFTDSRDSHRKIGNFLCDGPGYTAELPWGAISIWHAGAHYWLLEDGNARPFASLEGVKAAAQADYESRIRSALVDHPRETSAPVDHEEPEASDKLDERGPCGGEVIETTFPEGRRVRAEWISESNIHPVPFVYGDTFVEGPGGTSPAEPLTDPLGIMPGLAGLVSPDGSFDPSCRGEREPAHTPDIAALVQQLSSLIEEADADYAQDVSTAVAQLHAVDLWTRDVEIRVDLLRTLSDALTAQAARIVGLEKQVNRLSRRSDDLDRLSRQDEKRAIAAEDERDALKAEVERLREALGKVVPELGKLGSWMGIRWRVQEIVRTALLPASKEG